ncbi:hypothetical protein M3Y99_01574700 [Aphelenchoides fujianensis]|nr:hypothetical protein M3Y99_01574700 [Aphelenchoides fujianensis]
MLGINLELKRTTCIPYVISLLLSVASVYSLQLSRFTTPHDRFDDLEEEYYNVSMDFSKVCTIVFNLCCTAFFGYLSYVGGYFAQFGKRVYRSHVWIAVLMLLFVGVALIVLVITAEDARARTMIILLAISGLHCLLIIGSLLQQRVEFETLLREVGREAGAARSPKSTSPNAAALRFNRTPRMSTDSRRATQ